MYFYILNYFCIDFDLFRTYGAGSSALQSLWDHRNKVPVTSFLLRDHLSLESRCWWELKKCQNILIRVCPLALITNGELGEPKLSEDLITDGAIGLIELDQSIKSLQAALYSIGAQDFPGHLIAFPVAPTLITYCPDGVSHI